MAKVGVALTTGRTGAAPASSVVPMEQDLPASAAPSTDTAGQVSGAGTEVKASTSDTDAQSWVQPQSFKSLVGKGHADFSSGHQQVLACCCLGSTALCSTLYISTCCIVRYGQQLHHMTKLHCWPLRCFPMLPESIIHQCCQGRVDTQWQEVIFSCHVDLSQEICAVCP